MGSGQGGCFDFFFLCFLGKSLLFGQIRSLKWFFLFVLSGEHLRFITSGLFFLFSDVLLLEELIIGGHLFDSKSVVGLYFFVFGLILDSIVFGHRCWNLSRNDPNVLESAFSSALLNFFVSGGTADTEMAALIMLD